MEFVLRDHLTHWTLFIGVLMAFWCAKWVRPRFGLPAALAIGYIALSTIWIWIFRNNRYISVNPYDQMALRYFACDSIAKFMLIAVPLMAFAEERESFFSYGKLACLLFSVVNTGAVIWEFFHGCGKLDCGGISGNPSIGIGAMVCMIPLYVHSWRRQWPLLLPMAFAVFASQSSVAVGLLAVYASLWLLPWKHLKELRPVWPKLIPAAAALVVIFAIGAYAQSTPMVHDSGRIAIWRYMFEKWRAPWNILAGTGIGTYHVISVNLQAVPGSDHVGPEQWWNTLHNEPLQALFEGGVTFLLLFLGVYFSALRKMLCEKNFCMALSVFLFGLYMTMNPALHFPIPALFGAWLFTYALRREKLNLKEIVL